MANMKTCKLCESQFSEQQVLEHIRTCNSDIIREFNELSQKLNYLVNYQLDKCYLCGKNVPVSPGSLGYHWINFHPRIRSILIELVRLVNISTDPFFTYCLLCGESFNSIIECGFHIGNNHTQYLPLLYHLSLTMIASNPRRSAAIACELCSVFVKNRDPNDVTEEYLLLIFDLLHLFYNTVIIACRENLNFQTTEETCALCGEVFFLTNYVEHLSKEHPLAILMYEHFIENRVAFVKKKNTCRVCDKQFLFGTFSNHVELNHPQLSLIMKQLSFYLIKKIQNQLKYAKTAEYVRFDIEKLGVHFERNMPIVKRETETRISDSHTSERSINWQPVVLLERLKLDSKKSDNNVHTTEINWHPVVILEQLNPKVIPKSLKNDKSKLVGKKENQFSDTRLPPGKDFSKHKMYIKKRAQFYLKKAILYRKNKKNYKKQLERSYDKDPNLESAIQSNVYKSVALEEDLQHAMYSSKLPEIRVIIPGLINQLERENAVESNEVSENKNDSIEVSEDKTDYKKNSVLEVKISKRRAKQPSRLSDYVIDFPKSLDVKPNQISVTKHKELDAIRIKNIRALEKKIIKKEIEKKILICQKRLTKYVLKYEDTLAEFKLNLIHARKIITGVRMGNRFLKQMDSIGNEHVRKNIKKLIKDLVDALQQAPKPKKIKIVD